MSGLTDRYPESPTIHETPCDNCGSREWMDWVVLPHSLFNAVCPGGNGYLCWPCFLKLAALDADKEVKS